MRISVIGCGFLGEVHAASMAELGHEVIGVDVDPGKAQALSAGSAPFFKLGLPEILKSAADTGWLSFTTSLGQVQGARVHFIAVRTQQQRGSNSADLTYVEAAVDGLIPHLQVGDLVVGSRRYRWGRRRGWRRRSRTLARARRWRGTQSSSASASR